MRRAVAVSAAAICMAIPALGAARADNGAPKFAGLESATQCIPGPLVPHERQRVHLSWDAATPSKGIVYEIYMAKHPGAENFKKPNWHTRKLHFTTRRLPAGRYFVVRARNRAGKEDRNRIEKSPQNPCV